MPLEFLLMSRANAFTNDEIEYWQPELPDDIEELLTTRRYSVYNVMLVSRRHDIHYREGWGRILTGSIDSGLDPGPVWREVVIG